MNTPQPRMIGRWKWFAGLALGLFVFLPALMVSKTAHELSSPTSIHGSYGTIPYVLSTSDAEAYAEAFRLQRKGDFSAADRLLAQITSSVLKGHVLAERYMHRKYAPTAQELSSWLAAYADLPQAYDIDRLARKHFPSAITQLDAIKKPSSVMVMGDDNGLASQFDESKHYLTWHHAITAYQAQRYSEAASLFDRMIDDRKTLSPWKVSAAGFWSWRAHSKLSQHDLAIRALNIAASEPRSFYGILALQQLRKPLTLDETELSLNAEDAQTLSKRTAVLRAVALTQADRSDLAERELRIDYLNLSKEDRPKMLRVVHQLSLSGLQIALAKRLETKPAQYDLAKYPIPEWQPVGGFKVDPALIYALVRQESGFRSGALSSAGAMGLMQLMPSTAKMMDRRLDTDLREASEAERNVTLGQHYVYHLLEQPLVDQNIVFMLAAYNAGIGRLQEWKSSIDYKQDPLMFIEQIPYPETRYYVMQVMTNYWMYNEILGVESPSLAALAKNNWPLYAKAE